MLGFYVTSPPTSSPAYNDVDGEDSLMPLAPPTDDLGMPTFRCDTATAFRCAECIRINMRCEASDSEDAIRECSRQRDKIKWTTHTSPVLEAEVSVPNLKLVELCPTSCSLRRPSGQALGLDRPFVE